MLTKKPKVENGFPPGKDNMRSNLAHGYGVQRASLQPCQSSTSNSKAPTLSGGLFDIWLLALVAQPCHHLQGEYSVLSTFPSVLGGRDEFTFCFPIVLLGHLLSVQPSWKNDLHVESNRPRFHFPLFYVRH